MQLSNWNPFKFNRSKKTSKDKGTEKTKQVAKSQTETTALAPSAPPPLLARDWMRNFFTASPWMDAWMGGDVFEPFESLDRWFGDFSPDLFRPRVDVTDEGKMLRITAELPGLDDKDVKVTVDDGQLTITGEKKVESKTEKADCYRVERAYGSFRRVLPLPSDVDRDKVEASMDKGVLTVRIPKAEKASVTARTVPIQKS